MQKVQWNWFLGKHAKKKFNKNLQKLTIDWFARLLFLEQRTVSQSFGFYDIFPVIRLFKIWEFEVWIKSGQRWNMTNFLNQKKFSNLKK